MNKKYTEELTKQSISDMDYNQLIGVVKETNRPPGGKNSVFEIINRLHLTEKSRVLEIGTSTGFTPLEISRLVKCKITAIDINETSLMEARERANREGYGNIDFVKADINSSPFEDQSFDVVIIGNVFSLMTNKKRALDECMRVCKKEGFIVAIPMYYIKVPSEELVKKVSDAIQVKIVPMYKNDWLEFFSISELEIYWLKDFKFDYQEDESIKNFVLEIINRPHLKTLKEHAHKELKERYRNYMFLFRDNLALMGFTIIILARKRVWEDRELYTSESI